MVFSLISIAAGAALGAWLRWWLSIALNPLVPSLPLGTFTANAVGGFLIGVAVAYLAARPDLSPQWRLLVITGFLGGLTTFSTFSAEVVEHLVAGRLGWAATLAFAHVATSIAMTLAGIGVVSLFRRLTQGA